MSQWASRACSTESKMNGQSKFPLATTVTALALILGPLSAQADEAKSNQQAAEAADAAEPRTTGAGEQAAGAEQTAGESNTKPDVAVSGDVDHDSESDQASATDTDGADDGNVATTDTATADESVARSKSFTKTIATPHMTKSISRSKRMAKDEDGDMARSPVERR